jgi:apolipoprotein N-acyltransferase
MDVPLRQGSTWYSTIGDWPWILIVVALLGAALWFGEWQPRRRS